MGKVFALHMAFYGYLGALRFPQVFARNTESKSEYWVMYDPKTKLKSVLKTSFHAV